MSNIIAWTSVDEQLHANAGIYLINVIREELPEIFDEDTQNKIYQVVKESIDIEAEILDWIFSDGDIKNINKKDLLNFMKFRWMRASKE